MTPPESVIQFLWMQKKIPAIGLSTISGAKIQILDYGQLNTLGGPDIFQGRIKIDDTVWVGNIEFHSKASEWYQHGHHLDSAYNNVILHVVFENDKQVIVNDVELETLIVPPSIWKQYDDHDLLKNRNQFQLPCSRFLNSIPQIHLEQWKTRLLIDRIESKLKEVNASDIYNFSWSMIMIAFGIKYNKLPMKMMANSIDFRQLNSMTKGQLDHFFLRSSQLELPISIDEFSDIQFEIPVESKDRITLEWKFGGIRPLNQPIIKLMQFSSFFFLVRNELMNLLRDLNFKELIRCLDRIEIHSYWETHSSYNKKCKPRNLKLGRSFRNHLLLNAFLPLSFHLNQNLHKNDVSSDILDYYAKIPKERNRITNFMQDNGFSNENGFDSQSLIHLNNYYCQSKKCLSCGIGVKILNENNTENTILL